MITSLWIQTIRMTRSNPFHLCFQGHFPSRSYSSGSSDWVRGGAEKHEIYAATFGGHLFYDLFLQGRGGHGPLGPPGSATVLIHWKFISWTSWNRPSSKPIPFNAFATHIFVPSSLDYFVLTFKWRNCFVIWSIWKYTLFCKHSPWATLLTSSAVYFSKEN